MSPRSFKTNGRDTKRDVGCWKLKRPDGRGKTPGASHGILSQKIAFQLKEI